MAAAHSFVDLSIELAVPADNTLGEPESDFLFGRLNRVGAVAQVLANINAIVTTDGTRSRVQGVGGAEHRTTSLDNLLTFPDHANDGTRGHVPDETGEEGLAGEVSIVLAQNLVIGLNEL